MASTITLAGDWLSTQGNLQHTHGTGNLGTYAAGGIQVTANQVGLGVIEDLVIMPAGGYVFSWDKPNDLVLAHEAGADGAPLDEVGVTDISGTTFRFHATGH